MLRIIQNNSPDRARSYYSTADYYVEGQELVGVWKGKGAARLGLCGNVGREEWDALCDNRDPQSGEALTPRTKLDRLGWVREVGEAERYKALAEDYVATVEMGKSALVVSPTHLEGEWITDEIRVRLKQAGKLGEGERTFLALESANLTEAQKADPLNYAPGDVLVYHQNAKGHRKGERVIVGDDPLPLDQAERFQVYRPSVLPIAPGDVLRITRNGTTADGRHRLNNGSLYAVRGFDAEGNIVLANGWTVSKDYAHLAHGYVVTSHASQGKTVDRVFIGQSSDSLPATSREQFYVSVSRARERATVYTDDKEALLEAVSRSDDRLTATEFVAGRDQRDRAATLQRLERLAAMYDAGRAMHLEQERLIHER